MKWMYVHMGRVREVEAPNKQTAMNAIVEETQTFSRYWHVNDVKPWIPEEERCARFGPDSPQRCLHRRKEGSLCGVHAAEARRVAQRDERYRQETELDQKAARALGRITATTGVTGYVMSREVRLRLDQAETLAAWAEAHA